MKAVQLEGITLTAYLDITGPFYATQETFETAAAAMNLAVYCKHVILDMRSIRVVPVKWGVFGRLIFDAGNQRFSLNGLFKDRTKDMQE